MAPVLLCPECGTKHPLDNVADVSAFPCSGCGRTLKVPEQARELSAVRQPDAGAAAAPPPAAAVPPPPVAPAPVAPAPVPPADVHATQVFATPAAPVAAAATAAAVAPPLGPPQGMPALDHAAAPRVAVEPASAKSPGWIPPVWVRFLMWIVAVPLAFLVVFGLARAVGFLTTNEITDVALAEGWGRFWPILRLVPFVALFTALFVTGGVYGLARLRDKKRGQGGSAARPPKPSADQVSRTVV